MTVHTPQLGSEPHKLDEPRAPSEHVRVVQWNLSSSFPSAAHLGFFLVLLFARIFTASLQSSNRWIVRCVLWTFSIRSMLQIGLSFLSQLDLKIISTILRLESSGPSSDTVRRNFTKINVKYPPLSNLANTKINYYNPSNCFVGGVHVR